VRATAERQVGSLVCEVGNVFTAPLCEADRLVLPAGSLPGHFVFEIGKGTGRILVEVEPVVPVITFPDTLSLSIGTDAGATLSATVVDLNYCAGEASGSFSFQCESQECNALCSSLTQDGSDVSVVTPPGPCAEATITVTYTSCGTQGGSVSAVASAAVGVVLPDYVVPVVANGICTAGAPLESEVAVLLTVIGAEDSAELTTWDWTAVEYSVVGYSGLDGFVGVDGYIRLPPPATQAPVPGEYVVEVTLGDPPRTVPLCTIPVNVAPAGGSCTLIPPVAGEADCQSSAEALATLDVTCSGWAPEPLVYTFEFLDDALGVYVTFQTGSSPSFIHPAPVVTVLNFRVRICTPAPREACTVVYLEEPYGTCLGATYESSLDELVAEFNDALAAGDVATAVPLAITIATVVNTEDCSETTAALQEKFVQDALLLLELVQQPGTPPGYENAVVALLASLLGPLCVNEDLGSLEELDQAWDALGVLLDSDSVLVEPAQLAVVVDALLSVSTELGGTVDRTEDFTALLEQSIAIVAASTPCGDIIEEEGGDNFRVVLASSPGLVVDAIGLVTPPVTTVSSGMNVTFGLAVGSVEPILQVINLRNGTDLRRENVCIVLLQTSSVMCQDAIDTSSALESVVVGVASLTTQELYIFAGEFPDDAYMLNITFELEEGLYSDDCGGKSGRPAVAAEPSVEGNSTGDNATGTRMSSRYTLTAPEESNPEASLNRRTDGCTGSSGNCRLTFSSAFLVVYECNHASDFYLLLSGGDCTETWSIWRILSISLLFGTWVFVILFICIVHNVQPVARALHMESTEARVQRELSQSRSNL